MHLTGPFLQHTDDSAVYFREEYDSSLRKSEVISSTKTYVDDGLKTIVTTVQDISAAVLDAINAKVLC